MFIRFLILNIFTFVSLLLGLSSCTTLSGTYVERKGVNASLEGIIKAFDKSANGLRGKSTNGRELVSRYHSPSGDGYDIASTKQNRAYSKMIILGERRPYTLQVQYIVEKRDEGGGYGVHSYDDAKAQKVVKKIIDFLVTRPDREDFIDDFRPF